MLRGYLPRSPVWLRKLPSTVSGSQGSRRGLRPAVRFAFPLGARLNITLRARPCQELFSESFRRPSRGPRGASRPRGLGPSRRRVRYYTLPRRGAGGKPSRTQDADNSGAVKQRGWRGFRGVRAASTWRFAPVRMRGRLRSGARPARRAARFPPSGTPPKKKDGRLWSPPAFRAGRPSATVPGRFSLYLYIGMLSSGCRKCAWSSSRNAATHPWERPSLQACSRSSP